MSRAPSVPEDVQDSQSSNFQPERVIGNGSFGVVYLAKTVDTGELVAIKKVLQDRRFKNRELQIMKILNHPNIVSLKHCFYSRGDKPEEVYLNLVLDYVPETTYRLVRHYSKVKQTMPMLHTKLYIYQLCRALAYIHSKGICHRDIKPQNLLIDPHTCSLKLCDFGSAKTLVRGEPNVSYICSRYYRAPELIFGSTSYTTAVDVWSLGCVLAEMLLGEPLFPGENGVDQLVEIIKVLGTPTREQITAMNAQHHEFRFAQVKPHPWQKVFRARTPPEAVDLVSRLLQYIPEKRLKPIEALAHPFFNELRDLSLRLPGNKPPPPLFNFVPDEIAINPELVNSLMPPVVVTPPAPASSPQPEESSSLAPGPSTLVV